MRTQLYLRSRSGMLVLGSQVHILRGLGVVFGVEVVETLIEEIWRNLLKFLILLVLILILIFDFRNFDVFMLGLHILRIWIVDLFGGAKLAVYFIRGAKPV